jgi:hypothetical protein
MVIKQAKFKGRTICDNYDITIDENTDEEWDATIKQGSKIPWLEDVPEWITNAREFLINSQAAESTRSEIVFLKDFLFSGLKGQEKIELPEINLSTFDQFIAGPEPLRGIRWRKIE